MPSAGFVATSVEGEKKLINSELWHACAGPLVSLPPVGSLVVYFPQGHSEQVAASMQKGSDGIPSYPNLPSKLICMLHNVTLHADPETDEVYAQMMLQPVNKYDQEALLMSDFGLKQSRQPMEFFCKNLTASDTSTHGGFSVPRRAAEKIFPPLDFSMQPPAQELTARDLHDQAWTFRHIYRGQPKRHLLTTGWSVFVSSKRLIAGDAVLFIKDEKSQLLLGIRRAKKQQTALSSSVISSDSMHIGVLAAAAHAAANNSPFTIFYNPRTSPSEFVIPLAKYNKAMYAQVTPGMRFRMMFETEESGIRRHMGTITAVSDLDPVRWKNSQWRNLQVGWDESTAGERPSRVSIWDIEPVIAPFYICPPPFFRPKFPKQPGFHDNDPGIESLLKQGMPWIADDFGLKDASSSIFPGLSLVQWMSMQQNNQQLPTNQYQNIMSSTALPSNLGTDDHSKLLNFQSPNLASSNLQFAKTNQLQTRQSQDRQQVMHSAQNQAQILQQTQTQTLQHHQQQQHLPQPQQLHQSVSSLPCSTNGVMPNLSVANPQLQQTSVFSQLHQQPIATSTSQDLLFQQRVEQQPSTLLHRTQQQHHQRLQFQQSLGPRPPPPVEQQPTTPQKSVSEKQLQLQLLQKFQHHQQQILPSSSALNPALEPQFHQIQQQVMQNQTMQNLSLPMQQTNGSAFPSSQVSLPCQQSTSVTFVNAQSNHIDLDAPSCSTSSPRSNNLQGPQSFLKNHRMGPTTRQENSFVHPPPPNLVQETHSKPDVLVKQELPNYKATEHPNKYKSSVIDHLDASSSVTSYCFNANGSQQNLLGTGLDGDVQSHARNSLPLISGIDELAPDALFSRGYDSGKELQNLLSDYNTNNPRDSETALSPGINPQAFGVSNVSFTQNDAGVANGGGLWPNQGQRMRTYTKVQKRGSVGRTIDVTRYKGYDELRRDLARMFGIEGLLEDPHRNEWKLVYVDHENDILLVGDDPWEEFVSCVQSIKILSAAEVQQMSLDGDIGQLPVANQACSGTDSGNPWRGHYDDNSATSFNR